MWGMVCALAVAVVLASIVGFWLSYGGLHDFARLGGLHGPEAWAWPASVDLFTLAGELGVTISAITRKGDAVSWVLLAVGFLPSAAFNVAHVNVANEWWARYAVAVVPPVAAMLALAALLRQVYRLVLAMAPASGNKVSSRQPSDAGNAAKAKLRATAEAGNPLSKNQLATQFRLTRPEVNEIWAEVMPEPEPVGAGLNGVSHEPS